MDELRAPMDDLRPGQCCPPGQCERPPETQDDTCEMNRLRAAVEAERRQIDKLESQMLDLVVQMNEAVEAEREACARIIEDFQPVSGETEFDECAAIIRARRTDNG